MGIALFSSLLLICHYFCRYWSVNDKADMPCHYSTAIQQASHLSGWHLCNWLECWLLLWITVYGAAVEPLRGTLALLGAIQFHRIPLTLQFLSPKRFVADTGHTEVVSQDISSLPTPTDTVGVDSLSVCLSVA